MITETNIERLEEAIREAFRKIKRSKTGLDLIIFDALLSPKKVKLKVVAANYGSSPQAINYHKKCLLNIIKVELEELTGWNIRLSAIEDYLSNRAQYLAHYGPHQKPIY